MLLLLLRDPLKEDRHQRKDVQQLQLGRPVGADLPEVVPADHRVQLVHVLGDEVQAGLGVRVAVRVYQLEVERGEGGVQPILAEVGRLQADVENELLSTDVGESVLEQGLHFIVTGKV